VVKLFSNKNFVLKRPDFNALAFKVGSLGFNTRAGKFGRSCQTIIYRYDLTSKEVPGALSLGGSDSLTQIRRA